MLRSAPAPIAVRCLSLALASLGLAACGGDGSYELHWTVACTTGGTQACEIKTARDCAAVGFDSVQVTAKHGASATATLFPCFTPDQGPIAYGPGLDQGASTLEVQAAGPGGQLLSGPVSVDASIPASGFVRVDVNFPRPPACSDGVDNNGNGLVDLADPGCKGDPKGTSESP